MNELHSSHPDLLSSEFKAFTLNLICGTSIQKIWKTESELLIFFAWLAFMYFTVGTLFVTQYYYTYTSAHFVI